mgnify:CR=1 FL=1
MEDDKKLNFDLEFLGKDNNIINDVNKTDALLKDDEHTKSPKEVIEKSEEKSKQTTSDVSFNNYGDADKKNNVKFLIGTFIFIFVIFFFTAIFYKDSTSVNNDYSAATQEIEPLSEVQHIPTPCKGGEYYENGEVNDFEGNILHYTALDVYEPSEGMTPFVLRTGSSDYTSKNYVGFANDKCEVIIQPRPTAHQPQSDSPFNHFFSDGLSAYLDGNTNLYGYLNTTGEIVVPAQFTWAEPFRENLAVAIKNGKCGYINNDGSFSILNKYLYCNSFSDGLASVSNDGTLWGYIDKRGKTVIKLNLLSTNMLHGVPEDFKNGIIYAKFSENKYALLNKKGQIIGNKYFDFIEYKYNESYWAKKDDIEGFINNDAQWIYKNNILSDSMKNNVNNDYEDNIMKSQNVNLNKAKVINNENTELQPLAYKHGQYSCSEYHHQQVSGLAPTTSAIKETNQKIQQLESEIKQLESTPAYEKAQDKYFIIDVKINAKQKQVQELRTLLDNENERYNNYLQVNCNYIGN